MAAEKLQHEVTKMLEEINKKYLRNIHKTGYLCSAKCFDNPNTSQETIEQCIQRCQEPLAQSSNVLENEIKSFQNRVQRCVMDCQDIARDEISYNGKQDEASIQKAQAFMDKCGETCVNNHISLVSVLRKRIIDRLN